MPTCTLTFAPAAAGTSARTTAASRPVAVRVRVFVIRDCERGDCHVSCAPGRPPGRNRPIGRCGARVTVATRSRAPGCAGHAKTPPARRPEGQVAFADLAPVAQLDRAADF